MEGDVLGCYAFHSIAVIGGRDGGVKTWFIIIVLIAVSPAGAIAEMPLSITERSLVSNPMIGQPGLRTEGRKWELFFDARFFNDCLADTGIATMYSDLGATSTEGSDGIRLFEIRQKPNPAGCPDIYMPVTRHYRTEMSPAHGVQRIVLMNCFDRGSEAESRFQVCVLAVPETGPWVDKADSRVPVVANPRPQTELLPVLSNLRILRSPGTVGRRVTFTLGFDVVFPSDCHAEKGIEIEIIESPLGISDKTGNPVLEWLAVVNPGISDCPKNEKGMILRRYEVPRSVRSDYPRKLVVVNRTTPRLDSSELFFTADIWTGETSR